jgi:hypothetical protein
MSTYEAPKGSDSSDSPPQTSQQTPPPAPPPPSGSGGVSQVILEDTVKSGKKLYNARHDGKSLSELKELATQFANGYKTNTSLIPERGKNYYDVVTVPEPVPGDGRYHTYINVITGDIVIDYIGRDAKVEKSFPCSEILYQQFKKLCTEQNVTPKLTKITQEGVTGGGTGTASSQQIITHYITPTEETKSLTPESDGFYAVLGTINGKNAVFLIKDHGEELKIADISRVEIFFKKTPGVSGRGKLCFSVSFSS